MVQGGPKPFCFVMRRPHVARCFVVILGCLSATLFHPGGCLERLLWSCGRSRRRPEAFGEPTLQNVHFGHHSCTARRAATHFDASKSTRDDGSGPRNGIYTSWGVARQRAGWTSTLGTWRRSEKRWKHLHLLRAAASGRWSLARYWTRTTRGSSFATQKPWEEHGMPTTSVQWVACRRRRRIPHSNNWVDFQNASRWEWLLTRTLRCGGLTREEWGKTRSTRLSYFKTTAASWQRWWRAPPRSVNGWPASGSCGPLS